jgi:hypothetical protein
MPAAGMDALRRVPERRSPHRHCHRQVQAGDRHTPGSKICVVNHEEIGGDSFAHFERNGVRWPNADWVANVDNFCLFKN